MFWEQELTLTQSLWPNPHGDYLEPSYLFSIFKVTVRFFLLCLPFRDHAHLVIVGYISACSGFHVLKEFLFICCELMCTLSSLVLYLYRSLDHKKSYSSSPQERRCMMPRFQIYTAFVLSSSIINHFKQNVVIKNMYFFGTELWLGIFVYEHCW